ncbi:MAG: alcohol dehydrogenase [Moraxellaceae bacterium]|nr:MAG: alcohol dehydrogenase [Moraxellaceae bacterium]
MVAEYSFPTTILVGQGAGDAWINKINPNPQQHFLIVTDKTILSLGLCDWLTELLDGHQCQYSVFADIHANPIQEDVKKGVQVYSDSAATAIIAFGGGAAIDVAKAIKLELAYPGGIEQFQRDEQPWEQALQASIDCYAFPTTAGTGSEVGRSAVIILESQKDKTVLFHPQIIPDIAVLEPKLTQGLPQAITAATGIDALTHCLEAYLAPDIHPICDGIALQGMELVLQFLPRAYCDGDDLEAREKIQLAASMGAIAFQKGLGMVHSMAHPLSAYFNIHHGLANALVISQCLHFIEQQNLHADEHKKLHTLNDLFKGQECHQAVLSKTMANFVASLGISPGLNPHGVNQDDLPLLAEAAYRDPCTETNIIAVDQAQFLAVYKAVL